MRNLYSGALALTLAATAGAHEGHGLANPHVHASDVFGLLLAAAGGVAVWLWRSK